MTPVTARVAVVLTFLLPLMGCSDTVTNPISPQEGRRQVLDVSRQVVSDLGGELAEAKFGYDSCNDQGDPPFRAHSNLLLWMPGADKSREVAPDSVVTRLQQHGWQTDPDFKSHGITFKRNGTDVDVWVIPPPKPNQPPVGHVVVDVYGECRDTFDHRTDKTDRLSTDVTNELTSG